MSYNSKQLKVQSSAKKLPKPKDVDYISKMGYRDDSPFRDNSYNDIYTPNGIIDMSQTGIPLFANGQYLPPYSGTYDMGTENVREIPVAKKGGQKGLRKFTSKNIQTSLNDIMQRNTTLFGPSGKKRYKPDLNYKYGGWLDTYQTKGQVNPVQDSVRHQAIRSLQYEKGDPNNSNTGGGFDKNTKKAVGMSDWGYHESQSVPANPMFKSPTSLKQATDMWMQEVDPRTSPYFDKALTKSQANDFLFSTGRDIRPYIVDQIYKSQGKSGLPDRPKYNVDSKLPGYTQLKPEIDAMWAANKSAWDKLSYDDQQAMMGRSRQSYGQAIERGKGSINENLEAYNEVWKGRIPNLNSANYNQPVWWEQNNKKQYGGKLNSYQNKGQVNTSNWKQSSLDSLNLYNRGNEMAKWGKNNPNFTTVEHNKKADELDIKYPVSSMPWSGKNSFIGATNWANINSTKSGNWGVALYDKPVGVQKKIKQPLVVPTPIILPSVTPAPVAVPKVNTKFKIQETNFGPPIQYQYNPTTKQYVPITDIPKNTSKLDITNIPWVNGIKKYGGWLDQYQDGSETNTNTVNNAKENLTSYNENTDTYKAVAPLKEVNITEEAPQWIRDKNTKPYDKVNWWETLNYKKWGLTDYSDYSSFNSAFRNSKENNESEFMYKGKRYNTNLISKDQSDLYNESKQFLNNYYETQNYKPVNFNDYGDWALYMKEKTGTDWLEYYNSIKDSPEFTNIDYNNPESIKKYNAISDRLDELSSTDYDRNTGKEIDKKLNNKEYEEYVIQKNKKIELNNLNDKSYYFSITDQKPKDMEEDGYLDPTNPKNKKIFLTTNKNKEGEKNKLNTTYIHELSHKADDYSVYDRIPKIDIEYINKNKSIYPSMSQKTFDYLSKPSEIEARKMSLLFYNHKNKIDISNFTDDDFQNYYEKNIDKFPYDIKQLFDLYSFQRTDLLKYLKNDFSYLNNKKQYGGNSNNWLDSYQTGKEVTSEADYNKRLLLPNKSKEELAAQNAWVLKKNSSNKVVPYSWSPSGPYGPVKDVTSATPTYKGIDVSEQAIEQSKLRKEEKDRQARKDKITYDQSVGEHGKILGTLSYAAKKGDDWANSTEPGGGYETAGKALEFAAMSAMPLFEGVGLLKKPITTAAKWAFNNAAKSVATNTAKSIVKPVTKTVAKSINKPYKGFGEGLFNDQRLLTQEEMLAQEQAFYESQNYAVNEGKQTLNKILTQPLLPKVGSNSILQSQGFYNNFANQFNINNLLRESSKMSAPFSLRDSYTGFKDIYDTEGNVPKSKYFAPIVDAAFAVFPFTKIKGSSISNLIERPVTKLFENKNSIIPAVNYFVAKMAGKKAKGAVKDFTKNEVETLLENDNKNVIQKKYGGNNQKSIKKAVNYNRSSKFVNSQDSNWLNKYQ